MRIKTVGDGKEVALVGFTNEESSVAIKRGGPVFYKPLATAVGKGAVSAESLANASQNMFAGFNAGPDVAANGRGEAQAYGFFEYARVLVTTRAASTDAWASYPAVALNDQLKFVTAAGVQAVDRSGAGAANVLVAVAAAFSYASSTTIASTAGYGVGDILNSIVELRVFVRGL